MVLKIYLKNNYLVVENENVYGEGLAKDVRVNRLYVDIPEGGVQKYSFTGVNNITDPAYPFRDEDDNILFQDESGTAYTDEAAFETFYTQNTGKYSAGGGGATPTFQEVTTQGNTTDQGAKFTWEAQLDFLQEDDINTSTTFSFNYFRVLISGVPYARSVLSLIPFNGINSAILNYDRILNWHTYNDDSTDKTLRAIGDWVANEIVVTNSSLVTPLTIHAFDDETVIYDNGLLLDRLDIAVGMTVSFFNNGEIIITR